MTGVSELRRIPRPEAERDECSIKERSAGIRGTNFYAKTRRRYIRLYEKKHEFFIEILMK